MDISETSELIDRILKNHNENIDREENEINEGTDISDDVNKYLDLRNQQIRDGKFSVFMADPKVLVEESKYKDEPSSLKDEIVNPVVKKEPIEDKEAISAESSFQERFRCTICHNIMRKFGASTFKEHYSTAHFHKDIFDLFIKDNSETACRIEGCGKVFGEKNRGNLVRHIGSTHNKSVEILQMKGMKVPLVLMDNKRKRSDVKFDTKQNVKIKTEHVECEMCGKYFSTKSNLE